MKRLCTAAIVLAALFLLCSPASVMAAPSRRLYAPHRVGSVMTYNVYFGTDLVPVLQAATEQQLLAAVAMAWAQVVASDIPMRAAGIAREIADAKPTLVGLQEVAQW